MRKFIERLSNRLIKFLTSRVFFVAMILILQLVTILLVITGLGTNIKWIRNTLNIINILLILRVINQYKNTAYKLTWALIIGVLPLFGGILYLMFAERKVPKALRGRIVQSFAESRHILKDTEDIEIDDPDIRYIYNYLKDTSSYPYYKDTSVRYFKIGEEYFDVLLEEIAKAEHFIFIETFIIKDGYMLKKLTSALKDRIAHGVKVYMLYDDGGCITCLPQDFDKHMRSIGIKVYAFSPVSIRLSLLSKTNNRSHRKMVVIDDRVAFTGGYNIADEYINHIVRFGHWKDTGCMLEGEAVWSFTLMFIQFYNATVKEEEKLDYIDFRYRYDAPQIDDLILPFSDSPTDDDDISRSVHYMLITHAKKYIYIHTPYLVLDYDMVNSLCLASKAGVEVIITVPHIPDKKTVFMLTRSHYKILLEAGVKIYEYTPGFIHSKLVIVDDKIASIGTFNMDYRSYYLNYECGVLIAQSDEISKMKEDYLATLAVSERIDLEKVKKTNIFIKLVQAIMNVFSPLM